MATLKQRLHRKNSSGTYDVVHLETSASCVNMASGVTVEAKIATMDTTIAGKAASSHGTHVTWSTTTPKMNGTAAVGTETKVARGDHVHPVDTSRAAASHNHSAGNITSGILAVARGGTGVTANPSLLVNLGSTSAASVFAASPRPGVTGTLPVARGGTGVTTIDALKSALGIVSGGCKMAYGSGVSLSGLSFTPYVAILIGQYSSSVTGYYTWVAIKGYDTGSKLCCITETNSNCDAVYCKCTFSTSGVTFAEFNSNFRLYNYKAYVCAFGM